MRSTLLGSGGPAGATSPQIPHTVKGYGQRQIVVSCHVERPLDDGVWARFSALQKRRPGGLAITALLRPPDPDAGEDGVRWVVRAREAAARGPLGHHTHFTSPEHARPVEGGRAADRVRREAEWLRQQGIEASLFCGGGWYIDEEVAETVAELGYVDCTATAFRPAYLEPGARRAELAEPAWLALPSGRRLLELPSTHSLGMAARAALRALPPYVHVYFHDTDLVDARRRRALATALALLGRRARPLELEPLRAEAREVAFSAAACAR
jgi:hypothetical protein